MGLSFQDETLMSEATETLHFRVEHDQSTSETGYISQETRNDSDDIGFSSSNVDIQIVEERWYLREAAWFVIDEITLSSICESVSVSSFFFSISPLSPLFLLSTVGSLVPRWGWGYEKKSSRFYVSSLSLTPATTHPNPTSSPPHLQGFISTTLGCHWHCINKP